MARFSRSDVNMPRFDGFPIDVQVSEAKFEAETYQLLCQETDILVSRLLYYRLPVQISPPRIEVPKDILGRRLFVFEKAEGENNVWKTLNPEHKASFP